MSKFSVKVGQAKSPGAKPPGGGEPKVVHPGLALGSGEESYRCDECRVWFEMKDKQMEYCRCGAWFRVSVYLKFLRFTSAEYLPGSGPVLGRRGKNAGKPGF